MSHVDRYTCEDLFRLLDDYLDDRLSPDQVEHVLEHLALCAVCTAEYQFEGAVLEQVRQKIAKIELPEGLLGRITDRIRREHDKQ